MSERKEFLQKFACAAITGIIEKTSLSTTLCAMCDGSNYDGIIDIGHKFYDKIAKSCCSTREERSKKSIEFSSECRCESCGKSYSVWFTDNDIWNKFCGKYRFLCPSCFSEIAEMGGCNTTAWYLTTEEHKDKSGL